MNSELNTVGTQAPQTLDLGDCDLCDSSSHSKSQREGKSHCLAGAADNYFGPDKAFPSG